MTADHAFGRSTPFSVGLEDELFLVDSRTRRLAPVAARVLEQMDLGERAGHEAFAAQVEFRSPPCERVEDAIGSLAASRAAAGQAGATLLGAGLHPAAELGDAELVDAERYRRVASEMRGLFRRTPEAALHVHIGMPDAATAVRVHNALRLALPLLQGIAASSPFWFGVDSGLASARAAIVRAYPGRGIPAPLRDLDDWAERIAAGAAGGGPDDYTLLWWDVRLHPRLGTVELRELDSQSRLLDAAALAALVRGLARAAAEGEPPADAPAEAIAWSCFHAARDGLDAQVPQGGALLPLRDAARTTLDRVRPFAREQGDEDALEGVERVLSEGGGADRQRAVHARAGMEGLLDRLIEETAGR